MCAATAGGGSHTGARVRKLARKSVRHIGALISYSRIWGTDNIMGLLVAGACAHIFVLMLLIVSRKYFQCHLECLSILFGAQRSFPLGLKYGKNSH